MKMIQVNLIRPRPKGTKAIGMTTWLPVDKRIKEGVRLTLKGSDHEWTVAKVYDIEAEMSEIDHRGWDNNNYDKHESKSIKDRLK